ncbi:chloride channel protein [Deinococcus rubellus]|uniref:Chloride channel protein n=1 Tax=Deinococcus rubellus TaxID=1889240 RepID=A0ABY5YGV5_9DEIO|nr:chloride channel protein [Deinococcus rubellus]UWX63327.1 chloride channel protein [Deinococcus rubellus]
MSPRSPLRLPSRPAKSPPDSAAARPVRQSLGRAWGRPLAAPLTRTVRSRIETGRLVLYSLVAGGLVGVLGTLLRLVLGLVLDWGARMVGYSPPGTPGEGGLLMAFGDAAPYGLLALPLVAVLAAWLTRHSPSDPLSEAVSAYHRRGGTRLSTQLRLLGANLLGYGVGLPVGRDASFTALGGFSARLLARFGRLSVAEDRTLTLASVAAALGLVLHAPLAAAVLMAEVLYRRFEFEFEVLMPCVLAAVSAYAVYGLTFGAAPLFDVPSLQAPSALQLPLYGLIALATTLVAWVGVWLSRLWPSAWLSGGARLVWAGLFGLAVAAAALYLTPAVLGGGAGWAQLSLSGFLGNEALGYGGWKWVLLALGVRLGFGGGVLPSIATGALIGVGLNTTLPTLLDPAVCALVGASAYLTVTLNIPLAATLLAATWGGDALLPAALISSGLAHALSGQFGYVDGQLKDRRTAEMQLITPTTTILSAAPPESSEEALYRVAAPPSWLGARINVLSLPAGAQVVGLERGEAILSATPDLKLEENDVLDIVATDAAFGKLRELLNLG